MTVVPYKNQESNKKEQVAEMFDNISKRYDLLNHLLSMGIDIRWRKKAIKLLKKEQPKTILDVATGTGDFAIEALSLNPEKIVGVDISKGMLEIGQQKIEKLNLTDKISLKLGDGEQLPFEDQSFDAVIISFGIRNFENLEKGIEDLYRVIKPNGTLVVLEFSKPQSFPFKQIYNFYFRNVLPTIGKIISKDDAAYTYLPESVNAFPYGKAFVSKLKASGFNNILCNPLTFGISSIYIAKK